MCAVALSRWHRIYSLTGSTLDRSDFRRRPQSTLLVADSSTTGIACLLLTVSFLFAFSRAVLSLILVQPIASTSLFCHQIGFHLTPVRRIRERVDVYNDETIVDNASTLRRIVIISAMRRTMRECAEFEVGVFEEETCW